MNVKVTSIPNPEPPRRVVIEMSFSEAQDLLDVVNQASVLRSHHRCRTSDRATDMYVSLFHAGVYLRPEDEHGI